MDLNWMKLFRMTLFGLVIFSILLLDLYYYYPVVLPPWVSGHSLQIKESFVHVISEPNKSSIITFGVSVLDGFPPYDFVANWSDNFMQHNRLGIFSRPFEPGQIIPQGVVVSVTDSVKQKDQVEISFGNSSLNMVTSNTSSSLATSSKSTKGVLDFMESGLPSGNNWSLSVDGRYLHSVDNIIQFIGPLGNYSYSVFYTFRNIENLYSISPQNGTVDLDQQNQILNIDFSSIPISDLLSISGKPTYQITNGELSANVTYLSKIPTSTGIVVLSVLYGSNGNIVSTTSSTANVSPGSETIFEIIFVLPAPGQYTLDVSALTSNGTRVSNVTDFSISDE